MGSQACTQNCGCCSSVNAAQRKVEAGAELRKVHFNLEPEVEEILEVTGAVAQVCKGRENGGSFQDQCPKMQTGEEEFDCSTFRVNVERANAGARLGMDCKKQDRVLQVIRIGVGLMNDWNAVHPDYSVQAEDLIIAVNGLCGDAGLMLAKLMLDRQLELIVKRPAQGKVVWATSARAGLPAAHWPA